MGTCSTKTRLLEFIHNAAVESTKTPPLVVTKSVVEILEGLEGYKNIDKELCLGSILKEI